MKAINFDENDKIKLLTLENLRSQALKVFNQIGTDRSAFTFSAEKFELLTQELIDFTKNNYPKGNIPNHSRLLHFYVGDENRLDLLKQEMTNFSPFERIRSIMELIFISVILDAGAGAAWSFIDKKTNKKLIRSEALGMASLEMFKSGIFSSDKKNPFQVDSKKLIDLKIEQLREGLNVTNDNPIIGLEKRHELLGRLGHILQNASSHRLSSIFQNLESDCDEKEIDIENLSQLIIQNFYPLWTQKLINGQAPYGDVWHLPSLGKEGKLESYISFHKIPQWLLYSYMDYFMSEKINPVKGDILTALPEYRNGGLLLDSGVLTLQDPSQEKKEHPIGDPLIVEWRALTIAIIDKLKTAIDKKLNTTHFMGQILQGGTWSLGRKYAAKKRGGDPPLNILNEGTIF